jgi:hypothetical protein
MMAPSFLPVMAGPSSAIHVFVGSEHEGVDGLHEPGHDDTGRCAS